MILIFKVIYKYLSNLVNNIYLFKEFRNRCSLFIKFFIEIWYILFETLFFIKFNDIKNFKYIITFRFIFLIKLSDIIFKYCYLNRMLNCKWFFICCIIVWISIILNHFYKYSTVVYFKIVNDFFINFIYNIYNIIPYNLFNIFFFFKQLILIIFNLILYIMILIM